MRRTASSMLSTPTAVTCAVTCGWSQEVFTKLWAPRLYTSSGFTLATASSRLGMSVRLPSTIRTWSATPSQRSRSPITSEEAERRSRPYTS